MNQVFKHSALVWALIVTQMAFSVIGHGRVVVCHDDGGPSHIKLIQSSTQAGFTDDLSCVTAVGQTSSDSSSCTGTICVDEVLSLTFTFNTRRDMNLDTLSGLVPTGPPAVVAWMTPPETMDRHGKSTAHEIACVLGELQSLIRTTVLVL